MASTFRTHARFTRLATAICLTLVSGAVLAQDPKPPTIKAPAKPADPKARALLEEVVKAYQALGSYSDQGEFIVSMTVADKAEKQTVPLKLTFVRPNKLDLDAGPVRMISDGKTLTTAVIPQKKFISADAPEKLSVETFREGPIGAALFGGPSGVPMYILVNLLTSPEPLKVVEQLGGSLQLDPADPKGQTLLIDQTEGPDLRLVVDGGAKLLKAIDLVIDPKQLEQSAQAGRPIKVERLGWSSGVVSTAVAKDRSFAYQPPAGFAKVESFQQPGGEDGEEQKFAVNDAVGKPAPDFTLTVLDGPGKTRTLKKAELAGKVVVIDFWATWCGPCLIELPEIQKLVDELAKDKKNVLVVALSQDRDPKELAEVRKLVEETLKEKKVDFGAGSVGLVALDPSNSVGEAFQVEGLPTLVVLDGKGVVQSAHVGYSPDIRKKLTDEIDTLLAGKPLAQPKKATEAAKKPEAPAEKK
ncbi:TlpA disulfide reductase family protein [Paludisphaera borealis]|uniref:Thiol-disulfide oxidoreductase ResA n=1 Tax=Paludisphaera borealis TaxID=1387353 RepID=A0A1U7CTP1_9BACT|nr:TlpA disulfide reductase family protein [Paludisphaera borealis]APW62266.1 Thiol-disulfide oxidoreductase ResA [Paludisphaera borealis]